ncbi:MAG: putative sulfate exporter family transporter [Sulfuricaulis sp.]|nr:putative sulfate exporter family transporter [Sulfuricaulis sp.]
MIYSQKTVWTLILGIIMVAFGYLVQAGVLNPMIEFLKLAKFVGKPESPGEMIILPFVCGIIAIVVGLWQFAVKPKEGNLDYYLSSVGGVMFILIIAFVVKWGLDPLMHTWGKAAHEAMKAANLNWAFDFAKVMNLNYVVMGILAGIITVNVFKIPSWAENGVRLSRLGLKTGVVLLGVLYSWQELANLAGLSVVMIAAFVLGSVGMVLWMGSRRKIPNSMGGVLSAGVGVCGVSAAVAAAPVVNAKSTEIAYTIGTILLWGVLMMFIFPIVGKQMGMNPTQFGAWAGTGILNSAQVAGAALAFEPDGIDTLKVAEIFNITRILFLPIIVLWLALWYVEREAGAQKVSHGKVIFSKFPLFVLGFIVMFILGSTGMFAPGSELPGKYFDNSEKHLVKKDKEGNVKESKMLSDKDAEVLKAEADKVTDETQKAALASLFENKKATSFEHDRQLATILNSHTLSVKANKVLKKMHSAVYKPAPRISKFRDIIAWFFTFGLVGLGMQITMASIKQAGGQPLIIGSTVGAVKAVGSLIVVWLLVKEIV